jgi:hypothetical protein
MAYGGVNENDSTNEDQSSNSIMNDPKESRRMAGYWKGEITAVEELQATWHKRGDTILKRYRDERSMADESGQRRLNLLWSSVQILKPAVYGRVPQAICERKFNDHDPVGRISATILERALRNELQENGFHSAMRRVRDDYLLPGRGQLWVRYEPEIGEGLSIPQSTEPDVKDAEGRIEEDDESPEEEKLEETGSQIVSESAPVDYIHWKDFLMFPSTARTWEEVTAVGKRVYTSQIYNIERFGEDIGRQIMPDPQMTLMDRVAGKSQPILTSDAHSRKRIIYEIWNKSDLTVYWLSTGYDKLCDCQDDPLKLRNFFPCPEPLSATMTNDSLIPIPDFSEYQDQANQVDELTQRISLLTKALKVAGCYDAANKPLRRLLDESVENELIPVEGWAQFSQKGGLTGAVAFLPIKEVIETLQGLVTVRAKILEDFDRITGISALISQTNDARETLGGQRLKANGGQTRIEDRREEVGRFARDTVRLVAEVIAKHFQPETLIECSGILYEEGVDPLTLQEQSQPNLPTPQPMPQATPGMAPGASNLQGGPSPAPPPQLTGGPPQAPGTSMVPFQNQPQNVSPMGNPMGGSMGMFSPQVMQIMQKIKKAIDLLKSDIPRGYRIDIETDTMIAGDVQQERQDATEFLGGVTKFMEAAAQIGAQNAMAIPLLGKMLQWGVRKFRTGRDLESSIDEFVDKITKMAEQNAGQSGGHQSAEAAKGQADMAKAQAEIANAKIEMQAQEANDQREQQLAAMKHKWEMEKLQAEQQMARERHAFEMQKLAAERMTHAAGNGMPAPTMATATAQGHQDNVTRLSEAADKIHRAANVRKRIIYGPDKRPVGVEPIPEGE